MSQTTKCSLWQWPLKNVVGLCVAVLSWVGISSAVAQSAGVNFPNGSYSAEVTDLRVLSAAGPVEWTRNYNGKGWRFNRHWDGISASYKAVMTQNTGGGSPGASGAGGATCWIWVDEDWQPADTDSGSTPGVNSPLSADSYLPPNRGYSQTAVPLERNVSTGFTSGCGSVGGNLLSNSSEILEGYRRLSSLYVGASGSYIFKNRYILKKQPIQKLPAGTSANGGSVSLVDLETSTHGWRWSDRTGDWAEYDDQGRMTRYGDKNNNTIWLQRDAQGRIAGIVDGGTGGNATSGQLLISLHYDAQGYLVEAKDWPRSGNSLDLPQRSVRYSYDSLGHLSAVTDVRGHTTRYAYDGKARLVKTVDPRGGETVLTYEQEGNTVTSLKAADGSVTNYTSSWDDAKKLFYSKETGPQTAAGRREELYSHDRAGDLVKVEINGRTELEVKRDPAMRTQTRTNARGFATSYTQNEYEQTTQIVYPNGARFSVAYDARLLQPVEEIDELGIKTRYEYDSKGNLLTVTEAVGLPEQRITEYVRDEAGRPQRITRKGRTEANGTVTADATWHMTYDAAGNLAETTDPEGARRSYVYNRLGHLVRYTDPLGHATHYETDAAGNLLKLTNALGHVYSFSYDQSGNLVAGTDARGKTIQQAYDAMNRAVQATDAMGGVSTTEFDARGMPLSTQDADGRRWQSTYDNFSNLISQTDALANVKIYGYQVEDGSASGALGALIGATDIQMPTQRIRIKYDERELPTSFAQTFNSAWGSQTRTSSQSYDAAGQLTQETHAHGKTSGYKYDALGQVVEATDKLGQKTLLSYDARGNVIQVEDAKGQIHRFEYDRNNRLLKEILPLGQTAQYRYDAAGNLIERVDAAGTQKQYSYDAGNRVASMQQTQAGVLVRKVSMRWDEVDNLIGWSDTDTTRPAGQQTTTATLTYDDAGRKTGETISYPNPSGTAFNLGYGYQYSQAGYKTGLTWADGTQISYGYTAHGELENVSIPGEGSISVNQFNWVMPSKVTLPGGGTQNLGWDGLFNQESITVRTPGQQATLSLVNKYGAMLEITSAQRTDTAAGLSRTHNASYGYDDEQRLTRATTNAGGFFDDTQTFGLDAVANRTQHSRTGNGPWQYDANNRLLQRPGANGSAVVSYAYDANGNQIRKTEGSKVTHYAYDADNRLSEVSYGSNQLVARYGYDPLNRRIWKEQYRSADGSALAQPLRTYYLYSDEGLIAEATQPITLAFDGTVSASQETAISAQYGPRPDSAFTTGTLFVKTRNSNGQDSFAYYHHNHLQQPLQATDKAGNVVWAASYDAFGRATIITAVATEQRPSITSNLRLPGQYEDEETGLYYNWNRYYDPDTGRYITPDPLGMDAGVNYYVYVQGNPTGMVDPSGLLSLDPVFGAIYRVTGGWSPSDSTVNFFAGFGDTLSFNATRGVRSMMGIDGGVDTCSTAYSSGEWAGIAAALATGFVGGVKAAGSKGFGKEFSHWIPKRMGGPRTIFNGNYVPTATHALSDPYRYRFMPRAWKEANPPMNRAMAQWVRFPNVYKGTAAGGGYGAAGATQAECGCSI